MSPLKLVAQMIVQYWRDANAITADRRHHVQRLAQGLEAEARMNAAIQHDPEAIQGLLEQWVATDLNIGRVIKRLVPDTLSSEGTMHQSVHVQGCRNIVSVVRGDMIGVSQVIQGPADMSPSRRVRANVFISYRRSASQYFAYQIYNSLVTRLDGHVFFDMVTMQSGVLSETLMDEIRWCDVFLSVISHGTLDRLSQTDNWVRREITEALKLGKHIIPVIDGDTPSLTADTLPDDIQALKSYHWINIYPGYFEAGIEKLVALIDQLRTA